MTHDLRRHRRRSPLRRRTDRHAARSPGVPRAAGRPGQCSRATPSPPTSSMRRAWRHCPGGDCSTRSWPPAARRSRPTPTTSGRSRSAAPPGPLRGTASGYAPRRTVLDKILVDAAVASGVEVREGFNVDSLLIEDGTVVGIAGHSDDGERVEARARIVIGADGKNSHLAKAVRLRSTRPARGCSTPTTPTSATCPPTAMEIFIRPDRGFAAAPTNDGLTMVVVGWPYAEAAAYKADVEAQLPQDPRAGARVRRAGADRDTRRRRSWAARFRASSARRSARAGHSWVTPATTRTRSPRRASATPSSTPSGARPPSTRGSAVRRRTTPP